jgi:hypothetical protein
MPIDNNIRNLLGASAEFKALRDKTQRLRALQQVYIETAPVEVATASRVGYIRADTLYVFADNSAVAAKLRQLLPRVLPKLRKLEPQVTGIQIHVQAGKNATKPITYAKKESLSIDNVELFEILAKSVLDPDLKSALFNFANHNRKIGRKP